MEQATVYLSIGSNLGDRADNLREALRALAEHIAIQKRSTLYETEPAEVETQPRFYNIACYGTTTLSPMEVFRLLKRIEKEMGRVETARFGPRIIDIDLLFYDDRIIDEPGLRVPHPRLHERAFVLVPLQQIAPFFVHPEFDLPVIDLFDRIGYYDHLVWPAEDVTL